LLENGKRLVSLGQENYLFAENHEAAQRSTMKASYFAIGRKHEVNPYNWLK